MSLFRRPDGSKIKFDIIGVRNSELQKIKEMVERNGGKVKRDDKQPVKFTHRYTYVTEAFPSAKLYTVQFIKDCVASNVILSPAPYRIGISMMYDDHIMSHFLYGSFGCCTTIPIVDFSSDEEPASTLTNVTNRNVTRKYYNRKLPSRTETATSSQLESSVTNSSNETSSSSASNRQPPDEEPNDFCPCQECLEYVVSVIRRRRRMRREARARGTNISAMEEAEMLEYILDHGIHMDALNGLGIWKAMIDNNVCHNRTPGSLYKHFHNIMCPELEVIINYRIFRSNERRRRHFH